MKRREYLTRTAGLGALAVGVSSGATAAQSTAAPGTNILTIEDGTGDNNGNGDLVFPTGSDFYETAWDVDVFRLSQDDSRAYFEFEMAGEIQDPFGIGNGWSHEFFQIYVRDPNAGDDVSSGSSGRTGLKANLADPYQYRIVVHAEGLNAVEGPSGSELSTDVGTTVDTSTFVLDVPKSAIGGDPSDKEIAVLLCPYDGFGEGGLRAFGESAQEFQFGGASGGTPKVVDMVTGEGQSQSDILSASGLSTTEIPYVDVSEESGDGGGDDDDGDQPDFTLPDQENPAQSIDDDPLLEDVDGDGEASVEDAKVYFENRDSDVIKNNPDQFDFDGDGDAGGLFDALELWNKIK